MTSIYRDVATSPNRDQTHEGGIAYRADIWTRLNRFLILGSEGTYYATGRTLTIANMGIVQACLADDSLRTVETIVAISEAGRAPKQDPALFALALAASDKNDATRKAALDAVSRVCRTGTHLLHFAAYVNSLRGWGRGLRRSVGSWFTSRDADTLAYQAMKYQQRDGWSLADVLRLSHPIADDEAANAVLKWIVDGVSNDYTPDRLRARDALHGDISADEACRLILDHRLPREAVPTHLLNNADVWDALLASMPLTAMIRNLAKMTTVELLTGSSDATRAVVDRLRDTDAIRKARVHPVSILAALKVYEAGRGERGSLTWTPVKPIVNALDEAFYGAFQNVTPSGKRLCLALDVSASMDGNRVAGMPFLDARTVSAAMALVTASVEPQTTIVAYSHELVHVPIRPSMRLDEVMRVLQSIPMGGTICSLPIESALRNRTPFDGFASYTDSETMDGGGWSGWGWSSYQRPRVTANDALRSYREELGITARHAVIAATAADFTIADPADPGQLDIAGFDTATPALLGDFFAGTL